jgi:hypothetical protein
VLLTHTTNRSKCERHRGSVQQRRVTVPGDRPARELGEGRRRSRRVGLDCAAPSSSSKCTLLVSSSVRALERRGRRVAPAAEVRAIGPVRPPPVRRLTLTVTVSPTVVRTRRPERAQHPTILRPGPASRVAHELGETATQHRGLGHRHLDVLVLGVVVVVSAAVLVTINIAQAD